MGRLYVEGTRVTVFPHIVTRVPNFQCSTPASQKGSDCLAVNGCAAHLSRRVLTLGPKTCSLYALVTSDRQLAQAAPGPLFRRDAATHCDGVAHAGATEPRLVPDICCPSGVAAR